MNAGTADAPDTGSWPTYKRLLGYTRSYWAIGLVAFVGMLADGGGLALFTGLLKPMIDNLFAQKDPYLIFWMPIWIIAIFSVRSLGTFVSDYGVSVYRPARRAGDAARGFLRLPEAARSVFRQ